jgi:hypothetical protein
MSLPVTSSTPEFMHIGVAPDVDRDIPIDLLARHQQSGTTSSSSPLHIISDNVCGEYRSTVDSRVAAQFSTSPVQSRPLMAGHSHAQVDGLFGSMRPSH